MGILGLQEWPADREEPLRNTFYILHSKHAYAHLCLGVLAAAVVAWLGLCVGLA